MGTVNRAEVSPLRGTVAPALLDELWRTCEAEACGLALAEFEQIVVRIGMGENFNLASGLAAAGDTRKQQALLFSSLRMADLILARACAGGNERAWERFIALYRQPLLRAAVAITANESLGRELADGLYAELYGLTTREGQRRCPLDSYSGRGSLMGWLRTTLAQRHVDRHRRTQREQPLDETSEPAQATDKAAVETGSSTLPFLASAVEEALGRLDPEERFLLSSYYLDGRRLHEIAALLGVHEATISRKLKRATAEARKQILRRLERAGMSRRQAEEALATDPRDLTRPARAPDPSDRDRTGGLNPTHLRLKELLQKTQTQTFKEQAGR